MGCPAAVSSRANTLVKITATSCLLIASLGLIVVLSGYPPMYPPAIALAISV
ncbi:MAG: hypothetical protein PHD60_08510 [Clostridia bacterium]|nr:hypothetical protein [Clostridia bacterium]